MLRLGALPKEVALGQAPESAVGTTPAIQQAVPHQRDNFPYSSTGMRPRRLRISRAVGLPRNASTRWFGDSVPGDRHNRRTVAGEKLGVR